MRYSVAAAILLASTAIATPELAERDGYGNARTTTVTKTVYVTATAGPKNHYGHHHGKPKPHHKPKKVKTVYATVTSTAGCDKPTPVAPPPTYETPEPEVTPIAPPPVPAYAPEPEPSSPAYTPPTGDSIPDQCVRSHNEYRAKHDAPPVKWSQRLVDKASSSSYKCVFDHMHGTGFGENLAQGYSTVGEAIKGWYDENSQYNYGSGGFSMSTGHFTQLVWKGTTEIGCVFQEDCSGGPLLRCEYYPPGNYAGEYKSNVVA